MASNPYLSMKKIFYFVCMILGSCAFVGCSSCGSTEGNGEENDSVIVDSIEEVVDTIDSVVVDSTICND
jgi:hypothetical protein